MMERIVEVWDQDTYTGQLEDGFTPKIETYILKGEQKRGAVLICPGGGYGYTSEREAEPIALEFNAAGFHAFVLHYSVAPRKHPQPLLDVSRSIRLIREHAEEWNIVKDKIAVCGFSAGGHVAASLGVHWDKPFLQDGYDDQAETNRPDALILSYPVISSGEHAHRDSFNNLLGAEPEASLLAEMSLEEQVNEKTPPAFIWHTFEDQLVPVENSLLFAQAMRRQGIPFELHIYPEGPHGLSLATKLTATNEEQINPHVATWMDLCIQWLNCLFEA
ncbi:alpha/beta hydrolase [Paenibacillus aceti]|uniref:Acetylesterase n=1 Tax=Paenibacillus aceti TaxID=1820010 RepID=A0ABQ1VNL1_9BACL|nr:alpha/beta hydrolase [Paenibacillus aceti]GGF83681.1 acetylesterase [Paenibacillus aceti]